MEPKYIDTAKAPVVSAVTVSTRDAVDGWKQSANVRGLRSYLPVYQTPGRAASPDLQRNFEISETTAAGKRNKSV